MIEAVIFDWSGTLADDFQATLRATNATLTELGGDPVDAATYRRDFVLPVMGFYSPRLPGRTLEEIDRAFFAAMAEQKDDYELHEGARELLILARSRGLRLFVLSTMAQDVLEIGIERLGLEGLFQGVYGGASDKSRVMPRLLQENSLSPDRTVFVGDTPHDMTVGRECGLCLAASLYGYSSEEKMRAERPDMLLHSLDDLARALDRDYLFETQKLVIATVGGLLYREDGRILLVKTRKWSNTWGIPGGKIDYGETMLQAFERETLEETGLRLADSHFVMIQDCIESSEFVKPRHFLLINYMARVLNPEDLSTNYEIDDARWVTPEEAWGHALNEPTGILLKVVEEKGLMPESMS